MFLTIAKAEFLKNILSLRFGAILFICMILVVGSMILLAIGFESQQRIYENRVAEDARELENALALKQYPTLHIYRRPSRLSIFSLGLEREMGRSILVNILSLDAFRIGDMSYGSPLFRLFPPPDMTFVVNLVLTLAAVLIAFDTIAGDREDGVLRQMLANPVSRSTVMLGKLAGGLATVTVPFAISLLLGFIAIRQLFGISFDAGEWQRLVAFLAVSLSMVYALFLLSMLVSSFARERAIALVVALALWSLVAIILPGFSHGLARIISKTESDPANLTEKLRGIEREEIGALAKSPGSPPAKAGEQIFTVARPKIQKRKEDLIDQYQRRAMQGSPVTSLLEKVSPSSCYMNASMTLCGTGESEYIVFWQSARRFHEQCLDFTNLFTEVRKVYQENPAAAAEMKAELERKLPKFEMSRRDMPSDLLEAATDTAIIILFGALFFVGAIMRFSRSEIM